MIIPVSISMASAYITLKTSYDSIIESISRRYGNNPNLVKALIKIESNFNPKAHALTSKEDSRGLGQINRGTALLLERDPDKLFDPSYNIETINILLLDLKKRYTSIFDVVAAYNAGSVKKTAKGTYINSPYVINVYSRFLLYSFGNLIPDILRGGIVS